MVREYTLGNNKITLARLPGGYYADFDDGLRNRMYHAKSAEALLEQVRQAEGVKLSIPVIALIGH